MKLFVGLGNPGEKYSRNRHNAGFMAVERIADRFGLRPWRKRFHALVAEGEIGGERVILIKPQTYYNDAGKSVGEASRFLKVPVSDIVVFHDEIDLAEGKLRTKTGGGAAGNNGLRSITNHLSADFVRVRIGVGHPGHKDQVANYVLNDIPKAAASWFDALLDGIADAAPRLVGGDIERFQTDVSQVLSKQGIEIPGVDAGKGGNDGSQRGRKPTLPGAAKRQPPRGGRPTGRSGGQSKRTGPSQLDLARRAAGPRSKKQGSAGADETGLTPPSPTDPGPEPEKPGTALADKLKRWLAGTPKDKT
ncbi:MAG TPA: aminoacyl-tRNA hydrolase [Hyphomicrobiaceae bacterium]|nr:aminoacyl-tRNA hydrolase [Hyphomicrobiaceae bacterium]